MGVRYSNPGQTVSGELTGWLLDVYPAPALSVDQKDSSIPDVAIKNGPDSEIPGAVVWLLGDDGQRHRLTLPFPVTFYAAGSPSRLRELWRFLRRGAFPVSLKRQERCELFSAQPLPVLAVQVSSPDIMPGLFNHVANTFPDLTYFDADISLPLHCAARWGVFPLARCRLTAGQTLQALDAPWDLEPAPAPLRVLSIAPDTDPNHACPRFLELRARQPELISHRSVFNAADSSPDNSSNLDDFQDSNRPKVLNHSSETVYRLPLEPVRPLLINLTAILRRHDPDLLLTSWGDGWLLPMLLERSQELGLSLPFNRDPHCEVAHRKEHSYFSYGQIIYRDRQVHLFGRWHIDRHNAMLWDDYTLEGILESARVTGLPVQVAARTSPGTGISSMQIVTALRMGILVPWHKSEPERFKRAADLFSADQGGMVYQPLVGLHADVGGIDFISMYPGIMVRFNISPETAGNVPHRADELEPIPAIQPGIVPADLPGSKANLPQPQLITPGERGASPPATQGSRRVSRGVGGEGSGLVPQTLAPLLKKRLELKKSLAEMPKWDARRGIYTARSSAHKWLLVTCFGYLGYRNARFGRIEAHEAVTAYGREALLRAKETAEDLGFTVLHMYVDGLWVKRKGVNNVADFQSLLDAVAERTGLPIALDGIYRWVVFLPSRLDDRVPVANRYYGVFQDGSLKVRGIEARRRDTPPFIAQTQMGMLKILAQAPDVYALSDYLPQAYNYLQRRLRDLRQGGVPLEALLASLKLSRELDRYRTPSPAARAARQLQQIGKEIRPGQRVRFLYLRGKPDVHAWDLPELPDPQCIDTAMYEKLMRRASETVLVPLGGKKLLDPPRQLHFRSLRDKSTRINAGDSL